MSKDIRSFFNVISKKSSPVTVKGPKKKVNRLIDSDEEDVIPSTPDNIKTKSINNTKSKPSVIISSDSEDETSKTKTKTKPVKIEQKPKLKLVNLDDVFSNKPIKQSKVESKPKGEIVKQDEPKITKSKKKKVETNHGDEAFEKTLMELDDDMFIENLDVLDKTIDEALNSNKKDESEFRQGSSKENSPNKPLEHDTSEKGSKRQRIPSEGTGSTPKKPKFEHNDSGLDPDEEAFEKRRYSAMLYQKYKNRGGPRLHGQKESPKGNPNCLKNLTFLRTGVLDSLEGEEFENLIAEHGGRVVKGVSRKVNYLVVGDDPGPSKLEKAKGFGIKELNEDELFDLILVKSGKQPKYVVKTEDSQDSGVFENPRKGKELKTEKQNTKGTNTKKKDEKHSPVEKKKHALSSEEEPSNEEKPNLKKLKMESTSSRMEEKLPNIKKEVPETNVKEENPKTKSGKTVKLEEKPVKLEEKPVKLLEKPKMKTETQSKSSEETKLLEKPKIKTETQSKSSEKTKLLEKPKMKTETQSKLSEETISPCVVDPSLTWTEKYKPTNIQHIIGQQGDSSNLAKLRTWLNNWYRNQIPEVRKKIPRPSPWAPCGNGAYYKAALLSGPPGVGKTTTATLLSKELGFDVVEFNASDTRSKRLLQEEVSQLLSTTTIAGFAAGNENTDNRKRVLLMDEVDGMAGNEDRGGIQELINLIKNTSVPIICMCNNRRHQKMKSLINYCFELMFTPPRVEQIRGAMMSICFKEGLTLPPNVVTEIIASTGCDIRQTLNHLTMYAASNSNSSLEQVQNKCKQSKKDTVLGPFEVIRCVFSETESKMSLADKSKLFFYDYSLGPLFVQENYLGVTPNCPKKAVLKRAAQAADAISVGDLIDAKIRSTNNWSLLESQAMFASVLPGYYMSGKVTRRIAFPSWLGKNSSRNKRKRLLSELHAHTRMSISGGSLALKLDYILHLRNAIITPLLKQGLDGISNSVEVMENYNLLREDLNSLIELCQWKNGVNPFAKVDAKIKAAFTRAYNKSCLMLPYAAGVGFSKKKASQADDDEDDGDVSESDKEENDDVNADSLIKVKSRTKEETADKSKKGGTSKVKASAGTSKMKESAKDKAAAGTSKKGGASKSKASAGGSKTKETKKS